MVILITGASHTGKTTLAQKLMKQRSFPYLSIDHLKMGLIRSGNTTLTPMDSEEVLTEYLWPIVREMIKTVIENRQDLIVEGCYIPGSWQADFSPRYRENIRFCCLVMSECYIQKHFEDICRYANAAEQRLEDSGCTIDMLLKENTRMLHTCQEFDLPYVLIDKDYTGDIAKGLKL